MRVGGETNPSAWSRGLLGHCIAWFAVYSHSWDAIVWHHDTHTRRTPAQIPCLSAWSSKCILRNSRTPTPRSSTRTISPGLMRSVYFLPLAHLQASVSNSSNFFPAPAITFRNVPTTPSSSRASLAASSNLARSLGVPSCAYGFCTYPGGCSRDDFLPCNPPTPAPAPAVLGADAPVSKGDAWACGGTYVECVCA